MSLVVSFSAFAKSKFVTSCEANFIGSSPQTPKLTLIDVTTPYSMEKWDRHGATLTFDRYTLDLFFIWTGESYDSLEPMLNLNLYQDGNPYQGSLNAIVLGGLNLDARALNLPLTLRGMDFLEMNINGHYYSRVDYKCSVTQVE